MEINGFDASYIKTKINVLTPSLKFLALKAIGEKINVYYLILKSKNYDYFNNSNLDIDDKKLTLFVKDNWSSLDHSYKVQVFRLMGRMFNIYKSHSLK
jgi:hypothetical protein